MSRNKKPRVLVHCVANRYTADGERIIEFSDTVAGEYAGGLISFRRTDSGLRVEVYREERCAVVAPGVPDLITALDGLLDMVKNVLTDSQLDHEQCGATIRKAIVPAEAAIAKAKGAA